MFTLSTVNAIMIIIM